MKKLIAALLVLGCIFGATAVQMDFLMSGVMDNSGKPLSNGKVYFYVNNGGTTTKAIYTDASMGSAMAQPVALNASGVPTSIPYGSGTYRVVWKTSAGVTVKTVTDVQYGTDIASGVAVVDVGLTYGYNNAAVAAAIAYAGANPTTLYFSPGEYTIGTSKVFPTNVQVQFAKGAYWTVAGGVSVSLNASILAPQNENIFRGTGGVDISTANNPIILGNWKATMGVVDIQETINMGRLNGGSIRVTSADISNIFSATGTINVYSDIRVSKNSVSSGNLYLAGGLSTDGGTYNVKTKVIPIGAWNMDANDTKTVPCDIAITRIVNLRAVIYRDNLDFVYPIDTSLLGASAPYVGGGIKVSGGNIILTRNGGFFFDDVLYSSTAINRGYIYMEYIDQ